VTEVIPWDLRWHGNVLFPADDELHEKAIEFCRKNLAEQLDPRQMAKLWVARREGRVLGVTGVRQQWDIPLFRSIDEGASRAMAGRLNGYFADLGIRGQSVLLFLSDSEKPEQRCPNREAILSEWKAAPAERYVVQCR
jgi:hypothetical protein